MSISLLIQLGGRSVGDKASVIYHGEGNAQYRAMLIRAPSLKQWLWEAALPQIVSAEIHAYKSSCTGTFWGGLCSSDWIPNKTQAWRLLSVKNKKCVLISFRWRHPQQTISSLFCCVPFSGFGVIVRGGTHSKLSVLTTLHTISSLNEPIKDLYMPTDEILLKLPFLWKKGKKADLVPKKHKFKFVLVSSLLAGSQKLTTCYNTEGSLLIFSLEACRRDVGCKVTIPSWVFQAVLYYWDFWSITSLQLGDTCTISDTADSLQRYYLHLSAHTHNPYWHWLL